MAEKALVVTSEDLPRFQQEWARDFPEHDITDPRTLGPVKRFRNTLRRKAFERMATQPVHDRSRGKIDGHDVRRILIVRYDAIGDYVVTTPLEQWLRAAIPHAEIDMVTSPRNDSVARLDPNLTNTYPVDYDFRLRTPGRLKNIQPARERDYDLLFALTTTRMTKAALLSVNVAPRAAKVSMLHAERRDIYSHVFQWQIPKLRWIEHWAESFLKMGTMTIEPAAPVPTEMIHPYLAMGEAPWKRVAEMFRRGEIGFGGLTEGMRLEKNWSGPPPDAVDGRRMIVVNITAFAKNRQWSAAQAAQTCRGLLEQFPEDLVFVTGIPAEIDSVRSAVAAVNNPRCRVLSVSLPEFFWFIAAAALVITPDTATVHIAAAHRRPVVGLYAERIKAAEWYPYGTDYTLLISPEYDTINVIDPRQIVEAAEPHLRGARATPYR